MVCESPSGLALGRAGCRLAAVSHRPDGQGREDDVRGDGMHRRCETDGDDRHQQIKIERGELAAERARAELDAFDFLPTAEAGGIPCLAVRIFL